MMAQHWDVSTELRGEHGKWSKSGIIHKLAEEAKTAGKEKEAGKFAAGHRVKYKTGALGTIHHIDEKGTPHVVWDRGRGKPVRTPAHHLEHQSEQKHAPPRPEGAIEHDTGSLTERESKIRDETMRKLAYKPPRQAGSRGGVPAPTAGPQIRQRGKPGSEERKTSLRARMMEHLNKEGSLAPNERLTLANRYADEHYKNPKPPAVAEYAGQHQLRQQAQTRTEMQRASAAYRRTPSQAGYQRAQIKRKYDNNSAREAWMGKHVEVTHGPYAGESGKVISADKYGVTIDAGKTGHITPGHGQFKESVGKQPGPGKSPDELRKMIADMQAKEKARVEAENLARHGPGGGTQVFSGPMGSGRNFGDVHQEYQKAIAARDRMTSGRVIPGPLALKSNQRQIAALEKEMRDMGARRKNITGVIKPGTNMNEWEMPPKPGTPAHAAEKLQNELRSITEQLHEQGEPVSGYTPESLVEARLQDVRRQLSSGAKTIVVKPPSGSEIQMSPATAQHLLKKNAREYLAPAAYLQRGQSKGIRAMTNSELEIAYNNHMISANDYVKEKARRTGSLRGIR